MTTKGSSQQEPSQEVLDFLKEEMKLRFPLIKERNPDMITTRLQNESVFVDVWSRNGQWIMSSETSISEIAQLENLVADPERRAKSLDFFA